MKRLFGMESLEKDVFSSLEDGNVKMTSSASFNNTGAMIEQQMPTSSSSIRNSFKYGVLLSFWDKDIRNTRVAISSNGGKTIENKNFVGDLYEALRTKNIDVYQDDAKYGRGKTISDDLIKAIEDSKFYIIVFSSNYASSPWCLEVLAKIMECHKMPGHTAYAVFYDVEPAEVRDQSGPVGYALSKIEKEVRKKRSEKKAADLPFDGHKAKKWEGALKEAAGLEGWELKNTLGLSEHEDKFIKKIVQKISLELHYGVDANLKDVVTPANYFVQFIPMLNKLVEAIDLTPGSAFSFIITCLLAFAGLKSQSVAGFPFKTHANAIKVPVISLLIYAFASMAKHAVSVARLDHTSVYAIIARLGRISSLCLFVTSLAILICI